MHAKRPRAMDRDLDHGRRQTHMRSANTTVPITKNIPSNSLPEHMYRLKYLGVRYVSELAEPGRGRLSMQKEIRSAENLDRGGFLGSTSRSETFPSNKTNTSQPCIRFLFWQ